MYIICKIKNKYKIIHNNILYNIIKILLKLNIKILLYFNIIIYNYKINNII